LSFMPQCGRFALEVRTTGTHWLEIWVGPRADLDAVAKRTNPITAPAGK